VISFRTYAIILGSFRTRELVKGWQLSNIQASLVITTVWAKLLEAIITRQALNAYFPLNFTGHSHPIYPFISIDRLIGWGVDTYHELDIEFLCLIRRIIGRATNSQIAPSVFNIADFNDNNFRSSVCAD
jgi:hypothetical protein